MLAALLDGHGDFLLEDVEPVPPQPDEVVVSDPLGFACITDCIQRRDGGGQAAPHVRGHAGTGVVTAVGSAVTRVSVGQRVLAPTRPMCEKCFWCRHGQPEQCATAALPAPVVAIRADGTELRGSARVGSFAEQMKVRETQLVPIDSEISDEELVTLGCGAGGGLGAILNTATVTPDSTVLVVGSGVFGLSAVQGARIAGAARIIAVDPVAERRTLALALGATDVIDPTGTDVGEAVRELTEGRGACVVLEAIGGAEHQRRAFDFARLGGQIVLGGFGKKADEVTFPANDLAMRGKQVLSCQFGSVNILADLPRFAGFIESGDFDAKALVSARYPLESVNAALDAQDSLSILGAVIG
ncbi:zinc-binding dehydrogenase [Nocardioides marmotae]|uniref:zinc-binding dehydrogenase n=1 Tax=Nocardioides marmotae TaxID=2663857 RepID=UPI0012B661D8|nr:zinc-binding dehydrogenase [Nocardioides marmotae]MBC9734436.1 zinc-binding dehydrogenase [Nocardioides marmotae]MTB85536.1 zinc-binding dehydrogenase [Nocardioides marmotae]